MIMHEGLFLTKFCQLKPQIKDKKEKYFDLYYTIIKKISYEEGEKCDLR